MTEPTEEQLARAKVTQAAADEITAILLERHAAAGAEMPPGEMIATLLVAAYRASQSTALAYPVADFVALMREVADTVEAVHCQSTADAGSLRADSSRPINSTFDSTQARFSDGHRGKENL